MAAMIVFTPFSSEGDISHSGLSFFAVCGPKEKRLCIGAGPENNC